MGHAFEEKEGKSKSDINKDRTSSSTYEQKKSRTQGSGGYLNAQYLSSNQGPVFPFNWMDFSQNIQITRIGAWTLLLVIPVTALLKTIFYMGPCTCLPFCRQLRILDGELALSDSRFLG